MRGRGPNAFFYRSRPILRTVESQDAAALLCITVSWTVAVAIVNPLGEFPAVDDWAYLISVRTLVEQGELRLSDFASQNLVSHLLWGSLFAWPFGVSYTTLRMSTLVAALLGAVSLYLLVRNVGQPALLALFAALILLFNPIFFVLAFSFMTDVPFVAMQTAAMLLLLYGLNSGSRASSILGWLLTAAALLSRQTGLAVPLAYGGAYLGKHGLGLKWLAFACLAVLAFVGLQLAYEYWLATSGKMPFQYGKPLDSAIPRLIGPTSVLAFKVWIVARFTFLYLGLFLLPLSLPMMSSLLQRIGRRKALLLACCIAVVSTTLTFWSLHVGLIMPISPHTWRNNGLGADGVDVGAPYWFGASVTFLAALGGTLSVACIARGAYEAWKGLPGARRSGLAFGLLGVLVLIGAMSVVDRVYDRYLLPLIPFVALALVSSATMASSTTPRWSVAVGGLFLALMASFSIVGVHNYTAEKRVYVAAINDLVARGVQRDTIDAGRIFNGEIAYGRFGEGIWYRSRDFVLSARGKRDQILLRDYTQVSDYPVPRWPIWGSRGPILGVYAVKPGPK